jgi:hypothetical protein
MICIGVFAELREIVEITCLAAFQLLVPRMAKTVLPSP